jgi:glc operon protein GlcG
MKGKSRPMPIKTKKTLTSRGVRMMMDAAIAKAKEFDIAVTVAIVDEGGHLLMLERMEGGRFHTVHSATTKAVTAASNRRPTSSQGAQGQKLDVLHALGLTLAAGPQNWTAMEGGYPVMIASECLGGIGVAGGDWKQDEDIARAALTAIGGS